MTRNPAAAAHVRAAVTDTRTRFLAALAGIILAATACTGAAPGPDPLPGDAPHPCDTEDISGTVTMGTGSVPPPHNHTIVLEIRDGTATTTLTPGHVDDAPSWAESSEVANRDLVVLCHALVDNEVTGEQPPGSAPVDVQLIAGGVTIDISVQSTDEVTDAFVQIVGGEQWGELQSEYGQWQGEYERG